MYVEWLVDFRATYVECVCRAVPVSEYEYQEASHQLSWKLYGAEDRPKLRPDVMNLFAVKLVVEGELICVQMQRFAATAK